MKFDRRCPSCGAFWAGSPCGGCVAIARRRRTHGRIGTYVGHPEKGLAGCRCSDCREASRLSKRRWRATRRTSRGPFMCVFCGEFFQRCVARDNHEKSHVRDSQAVA